MITPNVDIMKAMPVDRKRETRGRYEDRERE